MKTEKILLLTLIILNSVLLDAQSLVIDVNIGNGDGLENYNNMSIANGLLFFSGTDSSNDTELYYTNGTIGNATKININPAGSSNPSNFYVFGNYLYFTADNGLNGIEWHRTNGTSPQILESEVGANGILSNEVTTMLEVGGDLYYVANTSLNGKELWKIPSGTGLPQKIEYLSGTAGVDIHFMNFGLVENWGIYNELVYEPATNSIYWFSSGSTNRHIWRYLIGSLAPVELATSFGMSNNYPLIPYKGKLYFQGYNPSSGFDSELWECDGINVQLAFDLSPTVSSSPSYLSLGADRLYFAAFNETTNSHELGYLEKIGGAITSHWDNTVPVEYFFGFLQENPFHHDSGNLLFSSDKVYKLDNTAKTWSTEHYFISKRLGSKDYVFSNNNFYFFLPSSPSLGFQVYSHGGTSSSTPVQVSNFQSGCDCPINPFILFNGSIFFPGYESSTGIELYKLELNACTIGYEDLNKLTGNQTSNVDYETDLGIDSDQILTGNITVDYDAGTSIDLLPGFQVTQGVNFNAFIDGCGNLFRSEEPDITYRNVPIAEDEKYLLKDKPLTVYPNPTQQTINIEFSLPKTSKVFVQLVDFSGRKVQEINKGILEEGIYMETMQFGSQLPQGLYQLLLYTEKGIFSEKVIYLKK